ncbi:hypothetical protein [Polluticoccus soli]|uniref:hypothetical protein n=1 Tax=Polluticoccus soli TaxID=3034150 RepID=UPI0023E101AE|nr:hypothetical protein [Flavipsychrobacter sp. JY13-12]
MAKAKKTDKDHKATANEAVQEAAEQKKERDQKQAHLLDKVDEINSRKKNEIPGKKLEEKMKDK